MGSSTSKVAKTAASSTARRYPVTASIPKSANTSPPHPSRSPSESRPRPSGHTTGDQQVDLETRDPDFGSRLSQLGSVQSGPIASNSSIFAPRTQVVKSPSSSSSKSASSPPSAQQVFPSTLSNPALLIVQARDQLAKIFEEESESLGRGSFKGRTLIGPAEIKTLLSMRDAENRAAGEIEKQLRLQPGVVEKLGPRGVVGNG